MTAREYMNQAYRLDERIRSKQEQIAALNDLATKCTAHMTGMPRNPNGGGSRLEDAVSKIVDLQEIIAADMEALVMLKADIVATIKAVENIDFQLILEKRYISNKSWPEIAVDLGYKMRRTYELHDAALEEINIPEKYLGAQ